MKLKHMIVCAIFAALLCICSPISIPLGTIPISLLVFAVLLCGLVLPWNFSFLSVLLFLLLSLCGLPVFSGGHSGVTALPGPTGGYIWSSLLVAPLVSLLSKKTPLSRLPIAGDIFACVAGVIVCYACGTVQFSLLAGRSIAESLAVCVFPFLLPDAMKVVAASLLAKPLRKLVQQQLKQN